MKEIPDAARPQHFKTIAREDLPRILRWFDDQRSETQWGLTLNEQQALLGNISSSLYHAWITHIESGEVPSLSDDVVRRLSILVGIHKSLEIFAPDNRPEYAVKWFLTPNDSATCAGQSIKTYLLANNTLDGFRTIEAYLVDAVNSFLGGSYS